MGKSLRTRIGVCQFEVLSDVEANVGTIARLAEAAAAGGAELVVLPEACIWPIDAGGAELSSVAATVDSEVAPLLSELAKRTETTLVVGLIEPAPVPRKVFNTIRVFAPDGDLVGAYRKIHLYDAFGSHESDRYVAGPLELLAFPVGDLTVGVMTCYDLRFPELARALVYRGADAIVLPAAWAQGALKEGHWELLLRARALENTCFVAAAGQCGKAYVGRSAIIDPLGVVVSALAEGEGVAFADVQEARLQDVRKRLPVLANSRLPRIELECAALAKATGV